LIRFAEKGAENQNLLLVVNADYPELVEYERIVLAKLPRSEKILFGENGIAETEMLHTDKHERKMRAGKMTMCGRIGGDGLIVFALERERVSISEPSWTETGVDENGFASGSRGVRQSK
jgi:hypothetical protein